MKLKLKTDKFRKVRGGYSRWLVLACEKCKAPLMVYQKDGPGILKRPYFDRIITKSFSMGAKGLVCKKCKTQLGIAMVYKKEKCPSYRLFAGAIQKKVAKQADINGSTAL